MTTLAQTLPEQRALDWELRAFPREAIALVMLIGLATALRAYRLADVGLSHFDEGPYCTSAMWTLQPAGQRQLYPKQELYAPPVYFNLVGLAYLLAGRPQDTAAVAVNVVFAVATLPLVWWMARRLAGPGAGLAAAALLALSDYHIAFSRTALTDVVFGFFLLLSVHGIVVAVERAGLGWAALAGLWTGLAWNTKYHGWLSLFIAAAAYVPFWLLHARGHHPLRRHVTCWIVATMVAGLCYLPWALWVEYAGGGYAELARYQRDFLSRDWLGNLSTQAAAQQYFDGWPSRLSPAVAVLACGLAGQAYSPVAIGVAASAALASGLSIGGPGTAALAALVAIPFLIRARSYRAWVMLTLLGTLFLLTPLYQPYPRLALPLVLAAYVAAGVSCQATTTALACRIRETLSRSAWTHAIVWPTALASVLAVWLLLHHRPTPRTWTRSDDLRRACAEIVRLVPPEAAVVSYEGAMTFYLRAAGRDAIPDDGDPRVIEKVSAIRTPTFVLTGIYTHRAPWGRRALDRLAERLVPRATYRFAPSDVRLLDDLDPDAAVAFRRNLTPDYDLTLYEVARE